MADITYVRGEERKTLPETYPAQALLAQGWEVEGGGDKAAKKPLNKMSLDELKAEAASLEIEVAEGATKAQIAELIVAKLAGI